MEITKVHLDPVKDQANFSRLLAFSTVVLDNCLMIHDLKVIQGGHGPFISMPCRKLTDRCPGCQGRNHLQAKFCNECGGKLDGQRWRTSGHALPTGAPRLYMDMVHPVEQGLRVKLEQAILNRYHEAVGSALDQQEIRYTKVCAKCGTGWGSLHCPHDSNQSPCPECGTKPVVIAGECFCGGRA